MYKICCLCVAWLCALLLPCSSLMAQSLVPQVVDSNLNSDISLASFPIYIVPNLQGRFGSGTSGYRVNNIIFNNVKNDNSLVDWSDNVKKQFWFAFADLLQFGSCYFSDICDTYRYSWGVSTAYYPTDDVVIDIGRGALLSYFFGNSSRNLGRAFFFCGLNGVVYYRHTPIDDVYDVFFYLYLVPSKANPISGSATPSPTTWFFVSDSSTPRDFVCGLDAATFTNNMYTFQFVGLARMELTGSSFQILQNDDTYSLPFTLNGRDIGFTQEKNYYWTSYGSGDKTALDYPSFNNYSFSSSTFNLSNWPYYETLNLVTAGGSRSLSSNNLPNLGSLDTDNGGMTDFHEWFQTKHNLLNPADDTEDTEEIEPPDIDDPPEGETVVDVGKDTVDRYRRYWDDALGGDETLQDLTPPELESLPSPGMRSFYLSQVYGNIEDTFNDEFDSQGKFKTTFDDAFSTLNPSDSLTWTINPSINSRLVQLPLGQITIDPRSFINDPTYGIYFQLFRGCLLLTEFLYFCYKLYKLALGALTGSGSADVPDIPEVE